MRSDDLADSFGGVADAYDRGRPRYPEEAIDRLAAELGLDRASTVVDLAAGTGKLTRDLVPRFGLVVAVEPSDEMRAVLERNVPGAEAMAGDAESIPLEDGATDAVLVAQAFHWFAHADALAEIARVLGPGGGLALLFNSSPWETREGPWFSALDDILKASRADLSTAHRHLTGWWLGAFDKDPNFGPPESAIFTHGQRLTPEGLIASLRSRSYISTLPEPERQAIVADVVALLERDDAPIDDGDVVIPLTTAAYWTRLRGPG
jgi:ubiquinone/menaquinone biosynthesis C-methylase UbiE